MGWLPEAPAAPTPLEGVLGLRPELLELYRDFYSRLWEEAPVPARMLELARLRIAQVHDCAAELAVRREATGVGDGEIACLAGRRQGALFSDAEQAALVIAEKIPWQHHEITDADAVRLRKHVGDPGFVAFMIACAQFDAICRLKLVFELEPPENGAPAPAGGRLY